MHRKRDALFVAPGHVKTYGLWIEFSTKKPGDFTGELMIADGPGKRDLSPRGYSEFHPETEGIYRVGSFVCGKDRWWQLRNHEDECFELFRSFDPKLPEGLRQPPVPHHWRPKNFSAPLEGLVKEAVEDFLKAMRENLAPRLPIKNA